MNLPRETVRVIFSEQFQMHSDTRILVIDESLHFIMVDQPEKFRSTMTMILGEEL